MVLEKIPTNITFHFEYKVFSYNFNIKYGYVWAKRTDGLLSI